MAGRLALGIIPGAGWRASDVRSVAQETEAAGFEAIFATEVNNDVQSGKDYRWPGFQTTLTRCRQFGALLAAARLTRISRRAHTLSQMLMDGYSIRAADMPGAA